MNGDPKPLGSILARVLGDTGTLYDVTAVRWMDGHRIRLSFAGLTSRQVIATRIEEEALPGALTNWQVTPAQDSPQD